LDDVHERAMARGIKAGRNSAPPMRTPGYPKDRPIAPEDVVKTVYHAMGLRIWSD